MMEQLVVVDSMNTKQRLNRKRKIMESLFTVLGTLSILIVYLFIIWLLVK